MKTLFINGLQIEFDYIIEFNQTDTNLLECFFFKSGELVANEFITQNEFNIFNNTEIKLNDNLN